MATSKPTARHAYRPRWRPASSPRGSPSNSKAALAPNHQAQRQSRSLPPRSKPDRNTPMAQAARHRPATARAGSDRRRLDQSDGFGNEAPALPPVPSLAALGLPQLFSAAQAAEILRGLGLTDMTECALRTRAYRKQIPFHLNGRQIRFTIADLREIAEGQARRPNPPGSTRPAQALTPRTAAVPRRSSARTTEPAPVRWRARGSSGQPTPSHENPQ
jgi:hypothetical protein